MRNSLDLAQHAERLGYRRYWLAEHHNMPGIASAATAVVIGHVAGGTKTIRVGSGGIMLPNHSPLVIAEQFGTLASLYPGRIDLGLGRAPGTDMLTARALRRDVETSAEQFPQDVQELQTTSRRAEPGQRIRAVPGAGLEVPIWLLGSSLFSAQLAAMLGLPFAFASHFAPDDMMQALDVYRSRFEPSNSSIARTPCSARMSWPPIPTRKLAACSRRSSSPSSISGAAAPGQVPPPIDDIDAYWSPAEKSMVDHSLACSFVGSAETVERGLEAFIEATRPDELMITAHIYDQTARLRSLEIVAQVRENLGQRSEEITRGARLLRTLVRSRRDAVTARAAVHPCMR